MTSLNFLCRSSTVSGLLLASSLASSLAWAQSAPPPPPSAQPPVPPAPGGMFSNAIQKEIPNVIPGQIEAPEGLPPAAQEITNQLLAIQERLKGASLEDLKNNPELAEQGLNLAIISRNWQAVETLLPIYREMPNADPVLIDYAQGGLYAGAGEYKKAIALYRKLIADDPNRSRVRMDLAVLLFADRQDVAARDQFVKLRSEPDNDAAMNEMIDDFLTRIDQRAAWSFDAGLSYVRDDNVNNASKSPTITYGGLAFQKREEAMPQSAQGFDFSLGAAKDFNIAGSHYFTFDAGTNGKIYWDNHDFDDVNVRVSGGYRYKDARAMFTLAPFTRFRYVGGDAYSKTYGTSLQGSYWFTPNWQLSSYNEIAWEKSDINDDAPTEQQLYHSVNALWAPKTEQFFMLGANVFDVDTGVRSTSYTRPGITFVWNQDWSFGGMSSRLNLGYGHRTYKDMNYMGIKRQDDEYNAGITLWKRDWHYWGITPKLSLRYNKVNSNIDDLYSYDKSAIFLQFDKTF